MSTKVRMASSPPTPAATILVIDDDPEVLSLAVDLLRVAGYTVLGTADPHEALRLARNHAEPLDLLLTDVVLPLMGGLQLGAAVRAFRPEEKVHLMLACRMQEIDDYRIREAPGGLFLDRPFPVLRFEL